MCRPPLLAAKATNEALKAEVEGMKIYESHNGSQRRTLDTQEIQHAYVQKKRLTSTFINLLSIILLQLAKGF